jgi:hypothetical protein
MADEHGHFEHGYDYGSEEAQPDEAALEPEAPEDDRPEHVVRQREALEKARAVFDPPDED